MNERMKEINKIFKTMMCPKEYKVGLVMCPFLEEADHWWDSVKPNEEAEQANPLTWERLKENMNE